MANLSQDRAPIVEALEDLKRKRIVPFDVPGHKRGRGNPMLLDFLGEKCLSVDANSMKCLDNLCKPVSVIRDAEELAAQAFGAAGAFFMVNGTTSAVQAMIMSACKAGDKIILPRNVHRSVINALVIIGAIPVYVDPGFNSCLQIALGMSPSAVGAAICEHPDAKAVLINNPTYYGICSDIEKITELAHMCGMLVLADEAHGTHFYFGDRLPMPAMAAGADFSAVSMHKSGGSLTQSSFLLVGPNVDASYVRQIINLTQTTSASYLMMSSLDISRKNLSLNGKDIFGKVLEFAEYARHEINKIGDYYAYSNEIIDGDFIFDFDTTKLSVNTINTGLAGFEVYDILRDEYDIQVEFGDFGNILAYISVGDRLLDIERLVSSLLEIRRRHGRPGLDSFDYRYISPQVLLSPGVAFYAPKDSVQIGKSVGRTAAEFVMCYPPGIPIVSPGELITTEVLDYILYAKSKGSFLMGPQDSKINYINVVKE